MDTVRLKTPDADRPAGSPLAKLLRDRSTARNLTAEFDGTQINSNNTTENQQHSLTEHGTTEQEQRNTEQRNGTGTTEQEQEQRNTEQRNTEQRNGTGTGTTEQRNTEIIKELKEQLERAEIKSGQQRIQYQQELQNMRHQHENDLQSTAEYLQDQLYENSLLKQAPEQKSAQFSSSENTEGLGVGHPAVDIICEFADCFILEEKLHLEKKGICTIYEFFLHVTKEYGNLGATFASVSEGSSLEYAITRFKTLFKALKKPSNDTMSIMTVLALQKFCPSISHRLSSSLASASSLTSEQRSSFKSDENPVLGHSFNTVPMRRLPGICEVATGTISLSSLVEFVISRISVVSDAAQRFDASKVSYYALDGKGYSDCDLLFSDEERLFNACTSWKGTQFIDDYDRAETFVAMCPLVVQEAYAEKSVDLNILGWPGFKTHLISTWKTAMDKQRMLERFKQSSTPKSVSLRSPSLPTPTVHTTPSGDIKDISIDCRDCNAPFTFSVHQQLTHQRLGFNSRPARCRECKNIAADPATIASQKAQPCFKFQQDGKCSFGENCKYSHEVNVIPVPTKAACNLHLVGPAAASVLSESDDDEGFTLDRPPLSGQHNVWDTRIS